MIQVAALIGVSAAVVGLYVSYSLDIASGAAIVILETLLFLLALGFRSIRSRLYAARGAAKR
jgi:iron/zinc/copper transport system permease protein